MRKIWKEVIIGLVLVLVLVGCIKTEQTIRVTSDGSGTLERTIGIKKELLGTITLHIPSNTLLEQNLQISKSVAGALRIIRFLQHSEEAHLLDETIKKYAESEASKLGQGVVFKGLKKMSEEDMVYYTCVYSFEDISKIELGLTDNIKGIGELLKDKVSVLEGVHTDETTDEPREKKFSFKFHRLPDGTAQLVIINPFAEVVQKVAKLKQNEENDQTKPVVPHEDPPWSLVHHREEFFKGMAFSLTLSCGDEIVKTNAVNKKENKIALVNIDLKEVVKDKEKFKDLIMKGGRFELEGKDDPEKIKNLMELLGGGVELEKEIKVEFK